MSTIKFPIQWIGRKNELSVIYSYAGLSQCIFVKNKTSSLIVDVGDGSLKALIENNILFMDVDAILITHGHFDHVGGLFALLAFLRMIGRTKDLTIVYPHGCVEVEQYLNMFNESYCGTIPFSIKRKSISREENFMIADIEIKPFFVVHCGSSITEIFNEIPALGYSILSYNERITISGDTGDCESLRDAVVGSDLALIEATFDDDDDLPPEMFKKVHLSRSLAEEIGNTANDFLLIHRKYPVKK